MRKFLAALSLVAATLVRANNPPNTPNITSPPYDGAVVNGADAHMITDAFSDPDTGDTQSNSDWQIWTAGVSSNIVWIESGAAGTDMLHTHLGQGIFTNGLAGKTQLLYDTDYNLLVRHRDNHGLASAWAQRLFHTAPATAIVPLLLEDAASTPTPTWKDSLGANVVLPPAGSLRIESTNAELIVGFLGTGGLTNPPALPTDRVVRVRVDSVGAVTASKVAFTDEHGVDHTIYLPAMSVAAGSNAFFAIAANGSTYYGDDFSNLARGAPVPWTVDQPGFQVDVVATGFQLPIGVAFVPSPGSQTNSPYFYVAELYGNIKVVTRDGTVRDYATHLLNFNPTGAFPGSGELGLCGILVDPNNGDVLASMVNSVVTGNDSTNKYPRVIRLHSIDGGLTASSTNSLLDMRNEVQGPAHQISNLTIGPDGKLYAHNGDGMNTPNAQNLNSYQGKILRINLDGTPCSDNPFFNAADGTNSADYVFVYGLRNPFGGCWRALDNLHYEVENGPNTDRFARVVSGRNMLWDGSDASMTNYAIYNWGGSTAPVHLQFIQSAAFGGSGFPSNKFDHAFVTESGATYATGPQATGKRISEFVLDGGGNLLSGPIPLIHYNGSGKATCAGMSAGPDGLYFTDLYNDTAPVATNRGANLLRIKFVGTADFVGSVTGGKAPLAVQFTDTSNATSPSAWLWDFGDGATSTLQNPSHTYTVDGSYNVRLTITGANGQSVVQKNNYITVASIAAENGGVVVLEAEETFNNISRSSHTWTLTNAATGFSGSGYMQALPDNGANINTSIETTSPEMQYRVNCGAAGTRYVWVRGNGVDPNGDSVHVGIGTVSGAGSITGFTPNNTWLWTNFTASGSATITASAGTNTLSVWMREDGMRLDRLLLTTNANFKPILGNVFHVPNVDAESDLGTTMRSPLSGMTPDLTITFYTGNQFQGAGGNPGNQLQTGSTLYYRNATNAMWSAQPMLFYAIGTHTPNGVNNKYYSASIPPNVFNAGDTVQYYFKIPYDDHLPTFVYGTDASSSATEIEATAQANPYSFTYQWPLQPSGAFLAVTNSPTGAEARIYTASGHLALGNNATFAPPAVKIGGRAYNLGRVLSSTPITGGLELRQALGATSIVARLTFPFDGVMRYEVMDWGGPAPSETSLTAASPATEHFYGFGEQFNNFDEAGNKVHILSADAQYKVAPCFVSTKGYGFHLDSTAESWFDMRAQYADRYVISNLYSTLKFNVIAGPKLTDVITRYTGYTGRAPLMPQWAFAPWMSSDIWRDGGEVRYVVSKYRERGIPGSVFVFDSPWEKSYNDFTWNTNQFSNSGTYEGSNYVGFATIGDMLTFLRTNGWKVVCWMTPFINTNSVNDGASLTQNTGQSPNYAEAALSNYFVRASSGGPPLVVNWWKGTGSPVDFTNPNANKWLVNQLSNLVTSSGGVIAGFKTDDGESSGGSTFIPTTAVYADGRTGVEMRNGYCVEYHKTINSVLGTNGVLLARSGFTGTQAYPAYWAGDNDPNFGLGNGMQAVIIRGLSAAMSGYSLWSQDICGYTENWGSTPTNLFMRWTQFGGFNPVMEMHRQISLNRQYPWSFGDFALANYQSAAKLHMALFPYLYSYAKESSTNGLPVMRPLVLLYPNDPNTFTLRDAYLFGNELLVAPIVTNNATSRPVYLPAGNWYDYWTSQKYSGNQTQTWSNADQLKFPLFVREGAIIPTISTNTQTLVDASYIGGSALVTLSNALDFLIYPTTNSSFTVYDGTSLQCSSNGTVVTATLTSSPRPITMRFFAAPAAGVERDGVRLPSFTNINGFVQITFDHAGGTTQIRFGPDSVGDGIPDSWRLTHFGDVTAQSCATCDPDGDGLNNAQEYLAGTDPNDSGNLLRVSTVAPNGGDLVVTFSSVVGMKYRVEKSDDLVVGWSTLADNVPGTGGAIAITDPAASTLPKRFYRIRLLP